MVFYKRTNRFETKNFIRKRLIVSLNVYQSIFREGWAESYEKQFNAKNTEVENKNFRDEKARCFLTRVNVPFGTL